MNENDYNQIKSEYKGAISSDKASMIQRIKARASDAHKGTFGHALIIAGSEGKTGASILCSTAALRTGCGLVTALVPGSAISPLLCNLPEAMVVSREHNANIVFSDLSKFDSIGFGPGIGLDKESEGMLHHLLNHYHQSWVIDADGLTLLSNNRAWYDMLNANIILTPHVIEFDRLTQSHLSDADRIKTQVEFSAAHKVFVLLKGCHTSITTPDGQLYFNTTGNNGMATAGSGDVLTGVITSLCAQGYSPENAAVLGSYLHGYAGDCAAIKYSKTSMIASDIIRCILDFFIKFEK